MKKIQHRMMPRFLAAGASLTMGLLSFGGTLALVSSLPLAIAGFVFSTVYEGEIYLQNIQRALKKLLKAKHLERQIARAYLLDLVEMPLPDDAPSFLKEYRTYLRSHHPNKKKLSDMEKWFALQLFFRAPNPSRYQQALHQWLDRQPIVNAFGERSWEQKQRLHARNARFVSGFSTLAGVFMGVGTSYLLVDAFLTIPMLAALPAAVVPWLIVPMAVVAGAAYGFLIYNATTDMMFHDTLGTWVSDIKRDWSQGNYATALTFAFMLTLSVALSVCTAGTWWTVAKTTPPLFHWMKRLPSWIMLKANPIISSFSTLIFNAQNISETLDMVKPKAPIQMINLSTDPSRLTDDELEALISSKPAYVSFADKVYYIDMSFNRWGRLNRTSVSQGDDEIDNEISIVSPLQASVKTDWQSGNPFQFLARSFFQPLRQVLFLGHLTSVSAVADRVPGVSALASACLGFINELFEDFHYFLGEEGHQHGRDWPSLIKERRDAGHGHDHGNDLPTQLLWGLFHTLYVPAALWDWGFGLEDGAVKPNVDFWEALKRQQGMGLRTSDCCAELLIASDKPPSAFHRVGGMRRNIVESGWYAEHAAYRIARYQEKYFDASSEPNSLEQIASLNALTQTLLEDSSHQSKQVSSVIQNYCFNANSFFSDKTREFLRTDLLSRLGMAL